MEMDDPQPTKRRRGIVAIDGAMALIAVLLIVQVWLLSATLEAFLAGYTSPIVPAAIFSGLLFVACAALNFFVDGLDRSSRQR
jgi:CHASE2 domain-containing sensor protein